MIEWITTSLGDLVTFQRGHDLPKKDMVDGPYPVVGSNGIIGWHNEFTTPAPSLSIGRSGNTGNPYYFKGASWSHNTALYVREFHDVDPLFMYYFLKTLNLSTHAGGSAVPTLNRNHIHSLEVRVPDLAIQKRIAKVLAALDDAIESNNQLNDYLAA